MRDILKYPRTQHIRGSRFQHGDDDMESVPFEELVGKHLIVEEKLDGGNCGISFDEDGSLLLQSRGHYLRGGPREKQFDVLKQWAQTHQASLYAALGERYVAYAENLRVLHTQFYNALPHYVMEFDVLDTQTGLFMSTQVRKDFWETNHVPICSVPVLAVGAFKSLDELKSLVRQSLYVDGETFYEDLADAMQVAGHPTVWRKDDMLPTAEGLYVKWEEGGQVMGRYKFVRDSFTSAILDDGTHWLNKPTVYNRLAEGALERMFAQ